MIRRPPRSTQSRSSAASDVYKRQLLLRKRWPAPKRNGAGTAPARPLPAWQLTKRALVGGDTEKVALEWANEQVWAACTGQIAGQERSRFPQYWPFPASPRRCAVNQKRREFVAGSDVAKIEV